MALKPTNANIRVLLVGDVVGKSGRRLARDHLTRLRDTHEIDVIIVNGENAAGGIGITGQIADELFKAGADLVTTGNHVWKHPGIGDYLNREPRLLRPLNYPEGAPGHGFRVVTTPSGWRLGVLNLLGRTFMDPMDCPFQCADDLLKRHRIGGTLDFLLVDFHAEASSEKTAMGYHLDGRASAVLGTHTHIPTADARILPKGTGFQTDVGMSGNYDSIIGMQVATVLPKFLHRLPMRFEPMEGAGTLCATLVILGDGLCTGILPITAGAAWNTGTVPPPY